MTSQQLLLLELNEVNFDFVRFYCKDGLLPNFNALIETSGWLETISESRYEHLEPWIQWVTAHTGKSFSEHGVFRLGDINDAAHLQIWEFLESHGIKAGAVSPMNATNNMKEPTLFLPDPWTPTSVSAPFLLRQMFGAIKQAVNDNAQARVTAKSAIWLTLGLAAYASPRNYGFYFRLLRLSMSHNWAKAVLLDLLLADVFEVETAERNLGFASLFLNAAAHIQHHYMFSSKAYSGDCRNPPSYITGDVDPVFEIYKVYDRILGSVRRRLPAARIMIATGLHQVPHEVLTYYWRLKDHDGFLRMLGVPFETVEPRMSRDFVVRCASVEDAKNAERVLAESVTDEGEVLFEVDNRGLDLFVMLVYPKEITESTRFSTSSQGLLALLPCVVFVAIKNGEHNGLGYFIDSDMRTPHENVRFPLSQIPARICEVFGLRWAV